jgi:hypothetical protein
MGPSGTLEVNSHKMLVTVNEQKTLKLYLLKHSNYSLLGVLPVSGIKQTLCTNTV